MCAREFTCLIIPGDPIAAGLKEPLHWPSWEPASSTCVFRGKDWDFSLALHAWLPVHLLPTFPAALSTSFPSIHRASVLCFCLRWLWIHGFFFIYVHIWIYMYREYSMYKEWNSICIRSSKFQLFFFFFFVMVTYWLVMLWDFCLKTIFSWGYFHLRWVVILREVEKKIFREWASGPSQALSCVMVWEGLGVCHLKTLSSWRLHLGCLISVKT